MTAKLHKPHRLLQSQMFNAFADTFFGNKGLGGLAVHVNISMSVRSVARQDLMRRQRKFRGGGSSWGGDIFAHKSSFARPTDVELRSKVVPRYHAVWIGCFFSAPQKPGIRNAKLPYHAQSQNDPRRMIKAQ